MLGRWWNGPVTKAAKTEGTAGSFPRLCLHPSDICRSRCPLIPENNLRMTLGSAPKCPALAKRTWCPSQTLVPERAGSASCVHDSSLSEKKPVLIILSFLGPFQNILPFLQELSYKERNGHLIQTHPVPRCRGRGSSAEHGQLSLEGGDPDRGNLEGDA